MQTLTDKEMANALLAEQKQDATLLLNLIIESSNQNIRSDAKNLLDKTLMQQKQLFDVMNQKGWYKVQTANPLDVKQAEQEVNNMLQ